AREVRVTVAPNAIHARFPSTLSDPNTAQAPAGPSTSGPGDRRWHDEPAGEGVDAAGRRAEDGVRAVRIVAAGAVVADAPDGTGSGPPVRSASDPLWLPPLVVDPHELVPVPMSIEPDPLTAALRATAASVAVAATATRSDAAAGAPGGVAVATAADGDGAA